MPDPRSPAGGARTLDNGLTVLTEVAGATAPLTVTELGRRLELDRTVVHRLVVTLVARRLLRRRAGGGYELGTGLLDLAAHVRSDIRAAAAEVLPALADELGCTTHLSVLDGDEVVSVGVFEPRGTVLHVGYRIGSRHASDLGAAGLAILLAGPARPGERPELAGARDVGYAVTHGELQPGAWGLAVPVRNSATDTRAVTASVGLVAMAPLDAVTAVPLVLAAAAFVAHAQ